MDDKQLIGLAKNGDIKAFEQLITQYQSIVYNIAYRMFNNKDDASDIAQEALIKVFKNIKNFKEESKFSTWIYKITYNVCIDEMRKRKKRDAVSIDECYDDSGDFKINIADTSLTPEQALENDELRQKLTEAINLLSPDHKAAIIFRDINGFSYEKIAEIQNCSIGTVKSRINRARQNLKTSLSKYLEQNYKD